jgi:hypothetical protein
MYILEQNARNITVRLTNAHWNRLMDLEAAYRTAQAIVKAKHECETASSMTVEEALSFIDTL